MEIGFKIKQLRERKNWSQQDLAYKIGVSQTKLCNIENDTTEKIDFSTMDKICEEFGVDFGYFSERKKITNNYNVKKNEGVVGDNNIINNNYPDSILDEVKALIDENKSQKATIKRLEDLLAK